MASLDTCNGSFNILDDQSGRIYVANKTADVNLNVLYMIKRINKSKASAKHFSCDCKCEFDGRKCNSNQKWNEELCQCQCKNPVKRA